MRRALAAAIAALVLLGGLAVAPSATSTSAPVDELVSLVRVHAPTRADRQRVADLGLDLSEHGGDDWVGAVLHGADDAARLATAGFTWTVEIADLVARELERARLDAAYAAAGDSTPLPSGRKAYRSLADYEWDMRELAKRNPGLVKLLRLVHPTLEGRAVCGIEITEDPAAMDGKPVFALMGVHHAREWPAGEHTIEFAFDLVQRWNAGDPRTRDLLSRARVIAVPIVNPDGFNASFEGATPLDGTEVQGIEGARGDESLLYIGAQAALLPAYKRKNCRMADGVDAPPGACAAPGARHLGTDPNRNYGALWGGAGASALPADDVYRGRAPFSEPESQNIRELVSSRQVTLLVTNHTFAGLVLRAPGVKEHGVTADEPAMRAIGAAMAAANGSVSQAGYELYDTTGTTEDWSYSATGGFGYTFEIPVLEFHPPFAETVRAYLGAGALAGKGNREAFYVALTNAAHASHHSVIAADAPDGAVLRLRKTFDTRTSPVRTAETQLTNDPGTAGAAQAIQDTLDSIVVPHGHVEWHVNPSTRPAVMERVVADVATQPSRTSTHDGQPAPRGEHTDMPFALTPDDASARLDLGLTWDTPDDMDLEVYRKDDEGLTLVASSTGPPAFDERVSIPSPAPGDYVVRAINRDSAATTFTLTAATFPTVVTKVHPALVPFETWRLTCETPDGRVLQAVNVLVSRGDRVEIDLSACRAAWPG